MGAVNVVVLLVVGLCVHVEGSCFIKGPTECVHNGVIIAHGERYESTEECVNCNCENGTLFCCTIGGHITDHPDDCKVVPYGPCSEKAVMKDDESKPCEGPIGMVGR